MKLLNHGDSLTPVFRFANHFKIYFTFKNRSECFTHHCAIICQ